jgi:hypothetical protein
MGAASALGQDASILSPLSQAFERTRLERADRTGAHSCFALAERSSEEAGPAQLVVVRLRRLGASTADGSFHARVSHKPRAGHAAYGVERTGAAVRIAAS